MSNLITSQTLRDYLGTSPPVSGGLRLADLARDSDREHADGTDFYARNPRIAAEWLPVYRGTVWAALSQQQWDQMIVDLLAAIDD